MIPEFGKSERPREQWPLIAPKGKPPQAKWILGVFADTEFSLLAINTADEDGPNWSLPQPYSELWTELAAMDLAPGKWWMIGHRVRYALDQADMLDALANGDIRLPRSKKREPRTSDPGSWPTRSTALRLTSSPARIKSRSLTGKTSALTRPRQRRRCST